jgi:hypothetical protein
MSGIQLLKGQYLSTSVATEFDAFEEAFEEAFAEAFEGAFRWILRWH